MGILDKLLGKKGTDSEEEMSEAQEEKNKERKEDESVEAKYDEACSLCGNPGTDKKWLGKYFHKKCLRKAKKVARGMI